MDASSFLFYLALVFLASYVLGGISLSRRLRHLCLGLAQELGAQPRRLGGNVAIVAGKELGAAIQDYSVALVLLGRTNPVAWLASRAAGRRDFMVLRARLKSPPSSPALLVRKGSPPYRALKPRGKDVDGFLASFSSSEVSTLLEEATKLDGLWLLRLNTALPHLEAVFELKGPAGHLALKINGLASLLAPPTKHRLK
jgi:hypothetical protein